MSHAAVEVGTIKVDTIDEFDESLVQNEDMLEMEVASSGSDQNKYTLTFEDVGFSVPHANDRKHILQRISGIVKPGEMLAIMGPSGSGKTTLLDLLCGRISSGHGNEIQGTTKLNGMECIPGDFGTYVPQEDFLYPTATVYETLEFSRNISTLADKDSTEQMIQDLGLSDVRDVYVGNIILRGISGGQKRRLGLGIELIRNPSLLFADEPTSGLDSASAAKICEILKNQAGRGRTIVCTIHSPNSQTFHMFDKVLFLSQGRQMYFGPTEGVVKHFSLIGKELPPFTNPADFMLQITNTDFGNVGEEDLIRYEETFRSNFENFIPTETPRTAALSVWVSEVQVTREAQASCCTQICALSTRAFWDVLRNPIAYAVRVVMFLGLSIMMGSIWYRLGLSQTEITSRTGVLWYCICFMSFMSIAAIPNFLDQRAVVVREKSNNWYNSWSFVIAETVVGLPAVFAMTLVTAVVLHFMCHLRGNFWVFLTILYVQLWAAESVVMAVSTIVPHYIIGMALVAALFCMYMSVMGYFVIYDDLPTFWKGPYYWAMHTYAWRSMMYNEYKDLTMDCPPSPQICEFPTGMDVLRYFNMEDVDISLDIVIILVLGILYRMISAVILQYFHTGKK